MYQVTIRGYQGYIIARTEFEDFGNAVRGAIESLENVKHKGYSSVTLEKREDE